MVLRESTSVSKEHLAFLVEHTFGDVLDEKAGRALRHRAASIALLEQGSEFPGERAFPHEEIKTYFLARLLLRRLKQREVPLFLRRSQLTTAQLEVFEEPFSKSSSESLVAFDFLRMHVSVEASADQLESNAGALLILGTSLLLVDRVDFLTIVEATTVGGSPEGVVEACSIGVFDATESNLSGVTFVDTKIGTLRVDEGTRFGISIPNVDVLHVHGSDSEVRKLRGSEAIEAMLTLRDRQLEHDASVSGHCTEAEQLLQRALRRCIRHHFLRVRGDALSEAILEHRLWSRVRDVLIKHDRLDLITSRAMGGPHSRLIRIRNPKSILDGSDAKAAVIHAEVGAIESIA
jgi:hypothetical protein